MRYFGLLVYRESDVFPMANVTPLSPVSNCLYTGKAVFFVIFGLKTPFLGGVRGYPLDPLKPPILGILPLFGLFPPFWAISPILGISGTVRYSQIKDLHDREDSGH